MNNINRNKLRYQIGYLEKLGSDIDIIELDSILHEIESLKEIEEDCFEKSKGGLKDGSNGIVMQENIEVFTEVYEIVELLREHINNLQDSIVYISEAI